LRRFRTIGIARSVEPERQISRCWNNEGRSWSNGRLDALSHLPQLCVRSKIAEICAFDQIYDLGSILALGHRPFIVA
jgi:hypothetical protein